MSYSDICNAPWMYIWVGVLLIAVIVQCLIFMKKAWTRARGLGLSNQQIRKGLTTGVTISIVPTLPVLVVFLSLMPLLGAPLPWLRLSVIGSAYYETYAATTALECVGESLTVNGYSAVGWIAAAWVMTVGGSACILWSTIMIKPISSLYNKAEKIDMGLVLAIGSGCLAGVMAYVSVAYGFGQMFTQGVVFLISFAAGAVLVILHKKFPKLKWISDYIMAISMLVGMAAACIIF